MFFNNNFYKLRGISNLDVYSVSKMHQQTKILFLCCVALWLPLCTSEVTIVDLTYPLDETTLYWPGVPKLNRSIVVEGRRSTGVWIEVGAFSTGEHGGTHMDVPRHFFKTAIDLANLPLKDTVLVGVHINAAQEADADPLYAVPVEKIEQWEEENGRIPNRAAVLINFGWSARWPDARRFFNSEDLTNGSTFRFPHMSGEATQWLVNERDVKLLGLDVPSPDHPSDEHFPAHLALLSKNRLILENVMIPASLPAKGFHLHCAPLKITGGTGAPTRVYAIIDPEGNTASQKHPNKYYALIVLFIFLSIYN